MISNPSLIEMFSTPLYTTLAEDKQLDQIQNEINDVVKNYYLHNKFKHIPNWNSSTHQLSNDGNFSECIIHNENLVYTKLFILEHVSNFMKLMKTPTDLKSRIVSSWLTLTKKGYHAHTHDHGFADISGVYYFKTSEKDGEIFFLSPSKAVKNSRLLINRDPGRTFPPQEGRLLLWPSYLDHGVLENRTDHDRISLSFNISLDNYFNNNGGIAQLGEQ